jgi:hypothetical protein
VNLPHDRTPRRKVGLQIEPQAALLKGGNMKTFEA